MQNAETSMLAHKLTRDDNTGRARHRHTGYSCPSSSSSRPASSSSAAARRLPPGNLPISHEDKSGQMHLCPRRRVLQQASLLEECAYIPRNS